MDEIAQYYNEVFKLPEELPFESLSHEDAIRFEKIFNNSLSFIGWRNRKALDKFKNELNKILSRINFKLRF